MSWLLEQAGNPWRALANQQTPKPVKLSGLDAKVFVYFVVATAVLQVPWSFLVEIHSPHPFALIPP